MGDVVAMKHRIFHYIANDDDHPLTIHTYIRLRKNQVYKNLILLSLSQSAMHIIYKTMMMLREYEHDFLGIWSYTIYHATKIFGFLLLPPIVLSFFKMRKTIRWGMLLNSLLILIHYIRRLEAVIPAAIIMGLVAATTWVSHQLYIYKLAKIMSKVSGDDLETVLLRFSGIFYSIHRAHEIVSFLPIAFVPSTYTTSNNSKVGCGSKFLFDDYVSLSNFTISPRNERSYVASVTLIIVAYCVLLLSTLLIDLPYKLTATHLGVEKYNTGIATISRLFKRRRLQLMIPMSLFAGYEKMIKAYDYRTAYVGCTESAPHAFYVHFIGCLSASQMSVSFAPLVGLTSPHVIVSLAASTYIILISVLLFQNQIGLISYYVISTVWGLASSLWDCLLYVLYGMLSPGEELESYCHLGLWYSAGAFANLLLARLASVSVKLWLGFVCLLFATASSLILPYIINYSPRKVEPINDDTPGRSGAYGSNGQRVTDKTRKVGVNFGKMGATREYHPNEVKSMCTSMIHHVAIPHTRPRFARHDYSNEDIRTFLSLQE